LIFNTFLSYFSSSGWHSKIRYGAAGSIMMNGTSVCKITIKYRLDGNLKEVNFNINMAV